MSPGRIVAPANSISGAPFGARAGAPIAAMRSPSSSTRAGRTRSVPSKRRAAVMSRSAPLMAALYKGEHERHVRLFGAEDPRPGLRHDRGGRRRARERADPRDARARVRVLLAGVHEHIREGAPPLPR